MIRPGFAPVGAFAVRRERVRMIERNMRNARSLAKHQRTAQSHAKPANSLISMTFSLHVRSNQ